MKNFKILFIFLLLLVTMPTALAITDSIGFGFLNNLFCRLTGCSITGNVTVSDTILTNELNISSPPTSCTATGTNVFATQFSGLSQECTALNGSAITENGIWNRSGTNVILTNSGDSVGINISNPDSQFHVEHPTTGGGEIVTLSKPSTGGNGIRLVMAENSGVTDKIRVGFGGTMGGAFNAGFGGITGPGLGNALVFSQSGGTYDLTIDTQGEVGIGRSSADASLHVNNDAIFEGPVFFRDNVTISTPQSLVVNETLELQKLDGTTTIKFNATANSYFNTGGNVGIGTASPNAKVEINGNVSVGNGTHGFSGFDTNGFVFSHGATPSSNFIAAAAGNSGITGADNILIGNGAGASITTSRRNVIIGTNAGDLIDDTNKQANVIIGESAMTNWNNGGDNVVAGRSAAIGSGTYLRNVVLGSESFRNAVGSSNVIIGYRAADYLTGTQNNKLIIANGQTANDVLIYGEFDNNEVGINTNDTTSTLTVNGNTTMVGVDDVPVLTVQSIENQSTSAFQVIDSNNDQLISQNYIQTGQGVPTNTIKIHREGQPNNFMVLGYESSNPKIRFETSNPLIESTSDEGLFRIQTRYTWNTQENAIQLSNNVGSKHTTGDANLVYIKELVEQSGTASSTALRIDRTENSLGNGSHYLIRGQRNSSDVLVVTNDGSIGVGTSTPSASLHVNDAIFEDAVFFRDNVTISTPQSLVVNETLSVEDLTGTTQVLLNATDAGIDLGTVPYTIRYDGASLDFDRAAVTAFHIDTSTRLIADRDAIFQQQIVGPGGNTPVEIQGGAQIENDLVVGGENPTNAVEWMLNVTGNATIDNTLFVKDDKVGIGIDAPTAKLHIDQDAAVPGIKVDQDGAEIAVSVIATGNTGSNGAVNIFQDSNVGTAFRIYSDIGSGQTNELVELTVDNAAFDEEVIFIQNDGVGESIFVDNNGNGIGINIDSESTESPIRIQANSTAVTCDASNAGGIYFNSGEAKHFGCDGTNWNALY